MPLYSEQLTGWNLIAVYFFQQNGSAMSAPGSELENAAAAMANGHESSSIGV